LVTRFALCKEGPFIGGPCTTARMAPAVVLLPIRQGMLMTPDRSLHLFALLLALAAASSAQAQLADNTPGNLVTNGSMSFAAPGGAPLTAGSYTVGSTPATLTGWTFLNVVASAEYWVSFGNQPGPDGGPYLGVQYLADFPPRVNVGGITQTLSGLHVGSVYDLSFYSMSNHDGVGLQDWNVSFGSASQTGALTHPNADQSGTWVQSTMTFTATAATQALTFAAQYLPGSVPEMLDLDGIVLREEAGAIAAVPEPSTYALMLAGLGAVTWLRQRRTKRS
jgi:hypothetical protein